MANTSECTRAVKESKLSDTSCSVGTASSDLEFVTALATEIESGHATISSSTFLSARTASMMVERMESGRCSGIEEQIERSKIHWRQLAELDSDEEVEVAESDNVELFKTLQSHPTSGTFFCTFGDGGIHDEGELVMGQKFAEGGQAELYEAEIMWSDPDKLARLKGVEVVLKVFKKGIFLRHLQLQWPQGLFQEHADVKERTKLGIPPDLKYGCEVHRGTLLRDGRFAFVMVKENEDLRSRIDRRMMKRVNHDRGPFLKVNAELIMYHVALGIERLHSHNIVHRDLKASNALYSRGRDTCGWDYLVAEYDRFIGVVGWWLFLLVAHFFVHVFSVPDLACVLVFATMIFYVLLEFIAY